MPQKWQIAHKKGLNSAKKHGKMDIGSWYNQHQVEENMEFQKLNAPSLKDLFISQIRENILSGQLPVGTKMPPEREIADQMQVSRAVVNSGFELLERQGFLEIVPRQGVFVADYCKNGNIDTLIAIMEYRGEMIKPSEIRSILEFRRAVEHLATDAFIMNATDEDYVRMEELTEKIGTSENVMMAVEAAFQFQHELAAAGGNSILPLIYVSFKPITTRMWMRFCSRYGVKLLYEKHRELYDTLRQGDCALARACTDRHMDDIIDGMHKIY